MTTKNMGKKIKAAVLENRMALAYAVGVWICLLVALTFIGGVWVMNHPEDMDVTFVSETWYPFILFGLFGAAAVLLFTLPFGEGYPAWRVGIMGFLAITGFVMMFWWYWLHPALFPAIG